MTEFDVIILGAGLAGLACARRLKEKNSVLSILILEGRNRVGGRTLTDSNFKDTAVDIGGQWIGPTQHLALELAKSLGLELEDQIWFEESGVSGSLCSGTSVELTDSERAELAAVSAKLEALAATVTGPPHWQQNSPEIKALDSLSVHDYLRSIIVHENVLHELQMLVQTVLAVDTSSLSAMYLLFVLRACGGLAALGDGPNGAQKWKVLGGAQQLSLLMLEQLQSQQHLEVRLGCAATAVTAERQGYRVQYRSEKAEAPHCSARGRQVVVALPPPLWSDLAFTPALPASKAALAAGMVRGCAIKIIMVFDRAFWERAGVSGRGPDAEVSPVLEKCGLVANLFPARVAGCPALVGLITGETATGRYMALTADQRRAAVAAQLKVFFQLSADLVFASAAGANNEDSELGGDPDATSSGDSGSVQGLYFVDKVWCSGHLEDDSASTRAEASFNSGCFAAVMPPGLCLAHGDDIRTPLIHPHPHPSAGSDPGSTPSVHFACTELSPRWPGYFEGALESGYQAAACIVHQLEQHKNES